MLQSSSKNARSALRLRLGPRLKRFHQRFFRIFDRIVRGEKIYVFSDELRILFPSSDRSTRLPHLRDPRFFGSLRTTLADWVFYKRLW